MLLDCLAKIHKKKGVFFCLERDAQIVEKKDTQQMLPPLKKRNKKRNAKKKKRVYPLNTTLFFFSFFPRWPRNGCSVRITTNLQVSVMTIIRYSWLEVKPQPPKWIVGSPSRRRPPPLPTWPPESSDPCSLSLQLSSVPPVACLALSYHSTETTTLVSASCTRISACGSGVHCMVEGPPGAPRHCTKGTKRAVVFPVVHLMRGSGSSTHISDVNRENGL